MVRESLHRLKNSIINIETLIITLSGLYFPQFFILSKLSIFVPNLLIFNILLSSNVNKFVN